MWGGASSQRKPSRLARDLDVDNLHDHLDKLRDYAEELSRNASADASRGYGRARAMASGAAREAEGKVKDHLAISLVLSLGLGMLVGYFIHRGGSE